MEEYDIKDLPIDGISAVRQNGKWGFLQYDIPFIPCVYEDSGRVFSHGLAAVKKNGKWGFINECNEPVIPFIYDDVNNFCNELANVTRKGRKFCINTKGEEITRNSISWLKASFLSIFICLIFGTTFNHFAARSSNETIEPSSGGFSLVTKNKKVGYQDKDGKLVVPHEYDAGKPVRKGKAWVQKGGLWGQISMKNTVHILHKYSEVRGLKEDFYLAKKNYEWGFLHEDGRPLTPFAFEHANSFNEGLAAINLAGYWGYIDRAGQIVIIPQFSDANNFHNGVAKVRKDGRQFYIDKGGNIIK